MRTDRPYRKYYRIVFKTASAMSVGSGESGETDRDVIRDSRNLPYIPGTTLAGIYRSLFSEGGVFYESGKEKSVNRCFGDVNVGSNDPGTESRLLVYDAVLKDGTKALTDTRDCVALDEFKTAKDGTKFDFEIVEPGTAFITYFELDTDKDSPDDEIIIDTIASAWKSGNIRIGSKTMRGLGSIDVSDISIYTAGFDLTDSAGLEAWLDFDMYGDSGWKAADVKEAHIKGVTTVCLKLKQDGPLTVRRYTTEVGKTKNDKAPDYAQLTSRKEGEEIPVIPGTTWAGAFRVHINALVHDKDLMEEYFGFVYGKGENSASRSKVHFSESYFDKGSYIYKQLTRNAIDRFTGGTIDTALFTERTCYNGTTELTISFPEAMDSRLKKAFVFSICDLNEGFLSIGGLTAVGHGLFKVRAVSVNKKAVEFGTSEELADALGKELSL